MTRKIVAWEVSNDDHAVIVLHSNGLAARREGANELNLDFDEVSVKRANSFDKFSDGIHTAILHLPIKQMMEDFDFQGYCGWCEMTVYPSSDYGTDEKLPIFSDDGERVFCNAECKRKYDEIV
jgi:hypothetical protein